MEIVYKGVRVPMGWAIEDVVDEYFNGDEDFITHFTMAVKDYVARETRKE